jgi:hypothetical protein
MNAQHGHVSIHIDTQHYESPNPTTGAALYVLGKVKPDYELFREVKGKGDDEPIANDATVVHLKEGEQFYSAKRTLNPGA